MERTKFCKKCGVEFTMKPKTRVQHFCSKECRLSCWVENNRGKLNQTVREYRARRYKAEGRWRDNSPKSMAAKAWMNEIKSKPCHDCGGVFAVCCMDFDHRDGTEKTYNVGSMFAHHYSIDLIKIELDKCDLVCANCHRIRTRDRRIGSGKHKSVI
jgi:hypothetical protein